MSTPGSPRLALRTHSTVAALSQGTRRFVLINQSPLCCNITARAAVSQGPSLPPWVKQVRGGAPKANLSDTYVLCWRRLWGAVRTAAHLHVSGDLYQSTPIFLLSLGGCVLHPNPSGTLPSHSPDPRVIFQGIHPQAQHFNGLLDFFLSMAVPPPLSTGLQLPHRADPFVAVSHSWVLRHEVQVTFLRFYLPLCIVPSAGFITPASLTTEVLLYGSFLCETTEHLP